jgi:predicted anti-sigma-YlaC factor YlaD
VITCATARERAPELALGILDGEERAELLEHLKECSSCQAVVAELSEIADLFPHLAPHIDAPLGFERRVVGSFRPERRVFTRRAILTAAAVIAAATITSIAVVRVVDADRDPQTALPELRTVAMVGGAGTQVGRVTVSDGTPAALAVSVDYSVPDGEYALRVESDGASTELIGTITIAEGRGEWNGRAEIPSRGDPRVTLVTTEGTLICEARLSD